MMRSMQEPRRRWFKLPLQAHTWKVFWADEVRRTYTTGSHDQTNTMSNLDRTLLKPPSVETTRSNAAGGQAAP